MVVVRGTKKFLQRVGGVDACGAVSSGALGDWYANVWFWRPQVALFVNECSLLPVRVPLAPAASVLERFPAGFAEVASQIRVNGAALEAELGVMSDRVLAKTASRSVLGVMNEFAYLADNYRWLNEVIDLNELSLWLANVPCGPLYGSYGTPDQALRALVV
jgi:hypothetical protein